MQVELAILDLAVVSAGQASPAQRVEQSAGDVSASPVERQTQWGLLRQLAKTSTASASNASPVPFDAIAKQSTHIVMDAQK
eukprot:5469736-Karenia_brevis.AAC.1